MTAVAFVLVAVVATLLRVFATSGQPATVLPWRTLAVNVTGSALLGLWVGAGWSNQIVITVAGLGSFTTFSTVAAESAALLDNRARSTAVAYLGLTLILGVAAALLGLEVGDVIDA